MLKKTATRTLVALTLLAAAGCGSAANPHPKNIDAYVAMGDSYTALAGVGPYTDKACSQTRENYPHLVAAALDIGSFKDVSCGGATSQDLTQAQLIQKSGESRPPQIDAVGRGTKLVTLGIGLNNRALAYNLLYVCLPVNGITNPACGQILRLPRSTVTETIKTVTNLVKDNVKDIRKAAPNARVVLVGYPRVIADDRDCPTALPLPAAAIAQLRSTLKLVNENLAKVAKSQKIDFIDMYTASQGHELCSNDPWMAGELPVPGKALQFHPYASYHRAVADKIVALLKK